MNELIVIEQIVKTDQEIVESISSLNTSQKIRYLAKIWQNEKMEPDRSRIAKAINKRYQHVRNVLITPIKKG